MGRTRKSRLDLTSYSIPKDTPLLGPDWVAAFSVYWRAHEAGQARQILDLVDAAMREPAAERSVFLLQKALRELGMLEVCVIRLILSRYVEFVRSQSSRAAQQIAAEVLATLLAIEKDRARGGRPRKA